jgi:hypothetical protein
MNRQVKPDELPLLRPAGSIATPPGADAITKEVVAKANAMLAEAGEPEDFDWDDAHILLNEQPETAIYIGKHDHIVIRQRCWPDDDSSVIIAPENAVAFMEGMAAYLRNK